MSRQQELESAVTEMIEQLADTFSDLGGELRWALTRTLIHRAVHFSMESEEVEYCSLATYFGEMLGHAHTLAHGEDPKAHEDLVH